MMSISYNLKRLLLTSLLAITLSSCWAQKIIIGNNVWPGCGVFYLAEKKGFFKDAGLEVEMKLYSDYSSSIAAFKNGEVDVIQEDIFSAVYTALSGVKYTAIMPTVDNIGFDELMALPKYATMSDLRNKRVGYVPGSVGHFLLLKALEKNNMYEKDIKSVFAGFQEVDSLLRAGKVDAGVCHYYDKPADYNVLFSTKEYNLPNVLMIRRDLYIQHYESIKKLVDVWQRAVEYFENHEEESILVMSQALSLETNKLFSSLMKKAPILDMRADAQRFYGDTGNIFSKVDDILDFLEGNPNTPDSIKVEIPGLRLRKESYFSNLVLKSAGFVIEDKSRLTREGTDYALLFAGNLYDDNNWKKLPYPINDAKAMEAELRDKYGFMTEIVENPSLDSMAWYLKKYAALSFRPEDQLLIFFSGNGYYDTIDQQGYLVARNSKFDDLSYSTYYPFSKLTSQVDRMGCKHIFLILDVQFSYATGNELAMFKSDGTIISALDEKNTKDIAMIKEVLKYKSRKCMTPSKEAPNKYGAYLPFTSCFIEALKSGGDHNPILTTSEIIKICSEGVPGSRVSDFAPTEPGNDFLFIIK